MKLKTVLSPPPFLLLPISPIAGTTINPKHLVASTAMSTSSSTDPETSSLSQVPRYHNQTKHSSNYVRGPRGLHSANQPDPFRRFVSSPLLPLLRFPARSLTNPLQSSSEGIVDAPLYDSLFRSLPPREPVSCSSISTFFYGSLALSAWKTAGYYTWSLRVNAAGTGVPPKLTWFRRRAGISTVRQASSLIMLPRSMLWRLGRRFLQGLLTCKHVGNI